MLFFNYLPLVFWASNLHPTLVDSSETSLVINYMTLRRLLSIPYMFHVLIDNRLLLATIDSISVTCLKLVTHVPQLLHRYDKW